MKSAFFTQPKTTYGSGHRLIIESVFCIYWVEYSDVKIILHDIAIITGIQDSQEIEKLIQSYNGQLYYAPEFENFEDAKRFINEFLEPQYVMYCLKNSS